MIIKNKFEFVVILMIFFLMFPLLSSLISFRLFSGHFHYCHEINSDMAENLVSDYFSIVSEPISPLEVINITQTKCEDGIAEFSFYYHNKACPDAIGTGTVKWTDNSVEMKFSDIWCTKIISNSTGPKWSRIMVDSVSYDVLKNLSRIEGVVQSALVNIWELKKMGYIVYALTHADEDDVIFYANESAADGIIFDEDITLANLSAEEFNRVRKIAKQYNPTIMVGIVDPSSYALEDFLNSGAEPDFVMGEWYSKMPNNFTRLKEVAKERNIKVSMWVSGPNNTWGVENTLNYTNITYTEMDGIVFFAAYEYPDEIKRITEDLPQK